MENQRVVMGKKGGPKVLKIISEALPEPGPKEVRVKVLATGISFIDILMREDAYQNHPKLPFTPGYDLVGRVDKIGSEVNEFAVDQHVAALTITGAYTQYICLAVEALTPIPNTLNPTEAEPLVLNFVTAYQMLYRLAHLDAGNSIVIHGAGGGVGTALLQLGKLSELKMFATASANKHPVIQEYGAEHIDYHKQQFDKCVLKMTKGEGADAVFDPIGGQHWGQSYHCLHPSGRLILYGMSRVSHRGFLGKFQSSTQSPKYSLEQLFHDDKAILPYRIATLKRYYPEWYKDDLTHLCRLLSEKKIKPIIAKTFPLSEIVEAHQMMEQANHIGRIVVLPNENI